MAESYAIVDGKSAQYVAVIDGASLSNSGTPTKVTVTTASTEIIAADPTRDYSINLAFYSGGPVFLHEDDDATLDDFPAATGSTGTYTSTRALNGIVASGTADVRTWPNGGA